jgi:hypothetical protein
MKHTEHTYIDLGYRFEAAKSVQDGTAIARTIRGLLESERIEDRAEALYLVDRGRQEARQGATA